MNDSGTKPRGATTYKDTAFGILPQSELLKLEIEGTKRGLEFIEAIVGKDKKLTITPELICELHETSFGWIFPQWAGKYRKIQVRFSDKEAPEYFRLPELVKNMCADLQERIGHVSVPTEDEYIIEVITLLAWFQHRFVFIHPFQDYNGRTARMLTILLLLSLNLPPIELQAENDSDRHQYLAAMQKADEGDYSFLEKLIGDALADALQNTR